MSARPGTSPAGELSRRFIEALEAEGFDFFTGVPCSLLAGVLRRLEAEPRHAYLSAVREDAAIGIAAGAWLGGARPVVFLQNSGLGVAANALGSLSVLYRLPALLVVSWRGHDGHDAPEHNLTGRITRELLGLLEIEKSILEPERLAEQVGEARTALDRTGVPYALLVRPGILQ